MRRVVLEMSGILYGIEYCVGRSAARYDGLVPASPRASRSARGASAKRDTKPELLLRDALRAEGLRGYRLDVAALPGRPDLVFRQAGVAVFCDGDFWHGKNLAQRIAKLEQGHNAPYWVEKIQGNVARDRRHDEELSSDGWCVLRFWESDIKADASLIADQVRKVVQARLQKRSSRRRRPPAKVPASYPGLKR
jgi:DNA mismatch endonuclease (patch repair protein)